jgi:hypothetical protein
MILKVEQMCDAISLFDKNDKTSAFGLLRLALTIENLSVDPVVLQQIPQFLDNNLPQLENPRTFRSN